MNISVEFGSNMSMAVITIDCLGFTIYPQQVIEGRKAIVRRMIWMRERSVLGKDLTNENFEACAKVLLAKPGVRKWAQIQMKK